MEILQSDDKLREEIINDAKIKAERIIKNANIESEKIINSINNQIKAFDEEIKNNNDKELETALKLINSSIELEVKKKIIKFSGDFINDVFNNIKQKVLDDFGYEKIILNLIIKNSGIINAENYIVKLNEKQLQKISKDKLLDLKLNKGKIIKIDFNKKINEEILLYSSDKKYVCYLSIDNFIKDLFDKERTNIYKYLIE